MVVLHIQGLSACSTLKTYCSMYKLKHVEVGNLPVTYDEKEMGTSGLLVNVTTRG